MLRKFGGAHGRPKRGFTEGAVAALEAYSWPGNVRELENKVKTALIMGEGPMITAADLGLDEGATGRLAVQPARSARARRAAGDHAGARDRGQQRLARRRAARHDAPDAVRPDGTLRAAHAGHK